MLFLVGCDLITVVTFFARCENLPSSSVVPSLIVVFFFSRFPPVALVCFILFFRGPKAKRLALRSLSHLPFPTPHAHCGRSRLVTFFLPCQAFPAHPFLLAFFPPFDTQ